LTAGTAATAKISEVIACDQGNSNEYAKKGATFLGVGSEMLILNAAPKGLAAQVRT
jgi:hypothetical protein